MPTMTTPVEIYYSSVCGLCTKALEFFRSRNVTFTAFAVEWDGANDRFVDSENARAMARRCGETVDFVPQMFIGSVHVKGWRKLEPMIASGEIDRLLPKPA
jgi:hypothetical protein